MSSENLAVYLYRNDNYAEALKVAEQSLALKKAGGKQLGADALEDYYLLVNCHCFLADYEQAEKLCYEWLDLAKRTIGEDDAQTTQIICTLAQIMAARENYAQSEELFKEAIQRHEKAGTADSEAAKGVYGAYAAALHRQGRIEESEAMERKAE